jgi:hypothetical protein
MTRFVVILVVLAALLALPSPAPSCGLCVLNGQPPPTFGQEWERAKLILFGTAQSSRFNSSGAPGSGTTDFRIDKVLKDDPFRGDKKVLELPRFIPILDPKKPPQFVVFCDVYKDKLDAYLGRPVNSLALLDYLEGVKSLPGKDRTQGLLYYFRYLDHPDETIAGDAFLEFARSSDLEIGKVARQLTPDKLRTLLKDPATKVERLSLFAFLLGACGNERDADFLKSMITQPSERTTQALDGLLGGYIQLRPKQGWELTYAILGDSKKHFLERFAVVRMLRFYHGWKPEEARKEVLHGLDLMVPDGDVADLAIEDLRRWKTWDLTDKILAQYGKASHATPIVRRAIVRYALCCPRPEAQRFVDSLRRLDGSLVREMEEGLELEKQK